MGLTVSYYYSLTQRQLQNIVNGYQRKEDLLSRERWQISRKIMFAYMCKYMELNAKETDIITFPWETKLVEKLTEEEEVELLEQQKASELFFANWDARKAAKA